MDSSIPTPVVPVPAHHQPLFSSVNKFVKEYMSQPGHDNSHDYHHILRVVSNTNILLSAEQHLHSQTSLDVSALFLAALLHDVGDRKYAKPGEDVEKQVSKALLERGADQELAVKVQTIVKHVSYSNEAKNPDSVTEVLGKHPELAIVQDADRLDAIGAVGVARCFAYGGAKSEGQPMSIAIDHFTEKLYKLQGMMKTSTGRKMAEDRTQVLIEFATHFNAEYKLSFTME
ncbi:hypothetical protein EJ04DRAFT_493902 [Polyplosphaeria fusca]|uniref:HD/PDEase domain-containing protein n=1 Tax=Polyplosphaeria fusca TaxID=682080 RepID=A0A9P4QZR1_9PLEO|nr:hypothetical protein EJ04DRAFT_493902 [Polyplosphaeria fusca]